MKDNLKKLLKSFVMYLLIFIILISAYMILLFISSLIPSTLMEDNVRKSSETLVKEGEKSGFDLKYKKEYIFTFTDALMINTAYSIDNTRPIESFILARKNFIPNQTKYFYGDSQYNLGANPKYINESNGDLYQTQELYALMHGENIEDSYEYARYWHGYLVILRPLLVLFEYDAIRIVLFMVTFITLAIMCFFIYKKINIQTALIYLIGLLAINIFVVTKSINEILIFLIAIISTIVLLLRQEKMKNKGIFFFIVGSISSFIDLLTAPLVTLGLTAITYFILLQSKEEKVDMKKYIRELLKIGIAWTMGYGLTWGLKWIITEVFFNRPLISQAMIQISYRSGNSNISLASLIDRSLTFLSKPVETAVLWICIIYLLVMICINFKKKINFKDNIKKCIPFAIIFFFPIIWYAVVKQHSYVHIFFTYRILVVSIISLMIVASKIFEKDKE